MTRSEHPRRHRFEPGYEPSRAWLLGLVVDADGYVTNASCVAHRTRIADDAWRSDERAAGRAAAVDATAIADRARSTELRP